VTYRDRTDAGEALADVLGTYAGRADVAVLGLARGGVAVAAPIAHRLRRPLDVLVIRKLGLPFSPEVAFGAVGPGDVEVRDARLTGMIGWVAANRIVTRAKSEVQRRESVYRTGMPTLDLTNKTALLVDDGLATGATARAAVAVARSLNAREVVVIAPVGAREAVHALESVADAVVCPLVPPEFASVSQWYRDFGQVSDQEVMALLHA
jgi:predicted phosphoribosyltransferase